MSVNTEADENLEACRDNVQKGIENLSALIIYQCWGSEDYSGAADDRHKKVLALLMEAKQLLR